MSCSFHVAGVILTMASSLLFGCDKSAPTTAGGNTAQAPPASAGSSNDITTVGIRLPEGSIVLAQEDGGGRDGVAYYEWTVRMPSPLAQSELSRVQASAVQVPVEST